jgi:hypothetical protein
MAKASAKAGGTSRIRFVMFDAEVADGEIGQITQAIQNALRGPAQVIARRLPPPAALNAPEANGHAEETHAEFEQEDNIVADVDEASTTTARPRSSRKPAPKPSVIHFDITSDPPLSSLADPKSNHKRYLKLAAWLHDHRGIEAVTADHIYTCYRHLGWPTDILDFAQPLRELKHKQYFTTPERGKYAINQLGLAKAAEVSSD